MIGTAEIFICRISLELRKNLSFDTVEYLKKGMNKFIPLLFDFGQV